MQKINAVSMYAIGMIFLTACGSAKPTDAPTQILAPTATIFALPTSAPTATPRVEMTATAHVTPTPTPPSPEITATNTITQLQAEAEKQHPNELVGVVNDKITFLFDKSDDKYWNDKIQTMMRNFTPEARAAIQQSTDLAYAMLTTRSYPTTPAEAEKMLKDYYTAKAAAEKAGEPLTYTVKAYEMDANGNVKYGSFDEPSESFTFSVDDPLVIQQRILAGNEQGDLPATAENQYYGPQSRAMAVDKNGKPYVIYNLTKKTFNSRSNKEDTRVDLMAHMRRFFSFALNDINPDGKAKSGTTGELSVYAQLLSKTPILGGKDLFK
ncbi:MAG TPA: hypothetical protein PLJ62_12150 [Thermoflexales bacterium]|nr:hypothetical protein [Thermoflexales bacterium]HRA00946.1 hypothetical protein [Thermoflexales bacterium]